MMSHNPKVAHKEQGSIIVMTALVLVVVIGFMALGVDLGILLLEKRQLANAVDAAALAGVQELPVSASAASSLAYQYGELNRVSAAELTVAVSTADNEVAVSAVRHVKLFFAAVLGYHEAPVSAMARARSGPVSGVRGAVPLSIIDQEFVYGAKYLLKAGSQPVVGVPGEHYGGNFGAIGLGGSGAKGYEENLRYGFNGLLRVGDRVNTEPGNMVGPTRKGIEHRLAQPEAKSCYFHNAGPHCPQYVIVPIITPYESKGTHSVTILGFAAFFIEGYNNSESAVVGRFLQRSVDGEIGPAKDYGLHAYKLVQ